MLASKHISGCAHRSAAASCSQPGAARAAVQKCRTRRAACCSSTGGESSTWQAAPQLLAAVAAAAVLTGGGVPAAWAAVPPTSEPGTNVGFLTNAEIDQRRAELHFRRSYDGHVAMQRKDNKTWLDLKCDLRAPGVLLMRDGKGQVYYVAYGGLKQIDLSDDEVVSVVAQDDWEKDLEPIQGEDDSGMMQKLQLTREGFYGLVSVIDMTEGPEDGQPAK